MTILAIVLDYDENKMDRITATVRANGELVTEGSLTLPLGDKRKTEHYTEEIIAQELKITIEKDGYWELNFDDVTTMEWDDDFDTCCPSHQETIIEALHNEAFDMSTEEVPKRNPAVWGTLGASRQVETRTSEELIEELNKALGAENGE